MNTPRIGFGLPSFGPHAGPEAIAEVARAAERLGFDSVSLSERLLLPAGPDWHNEARLPESYVWEPLETLTWAAAHTSRIRLATGIVNALFQPPLILARRLATLDRLSGGRLDVGIGQGWLPEEFTATGVPAGRRGAGFEEHIAAMRACWGPDPVRYEGKFYRIPPATVGPKPVNGPLPLVIGAGARSAVERAARLGAGFVTVVFPQDWDTARTQIDWYRDAGGAGPLVIRILAVSQDTPDPVATLVDGAREQRKRCVELGADEIQWGDLNLAEVPVQDQVVAMEAMAAALDLDAS
ncbi:TIGR03619 family F420-dependent LLM class oxidoreductase [Streptomyces sp. NPDC001939]